MQDITRILADLEEVQGQPMTTSRKVAARFKKDHAKVLRSIASIMAGMSEEFSQANFGLASYADAQGKQRKEYTMTKDGFVMLAMGFTGSDALAWKESYIKAFNAMAAEIARAAHVPAVPLTLHEQALKLHAEAKTSETLATIYGRGLRKRRDDKPVFAQQLAQIERAMQICLFLGLDGLPDID